MDANYGAIIFLVVVNVIFWVAIENLEMSQNEAEIERKKGDKEA